MARDRAAETSEVDGVSDRRGGEFGCGRAVCWDTVLDHLDSSLGQSSLWGEEGVMMSVDPTQRSIKFAIKAVQ